MFKPGGLRGEVVLEFGVGWELKPGFEEGRMGHTWAVVGAGNGSQAPSP